MTRHALRAKLYDILERPEQSRGAARVLEIALIVLIALNVLAVLLETVPEVYAKHHASFLSFDIFSVIVFTVEYLARLWVSPEAHDRPLSMLERRRARLRWMVTPMALVDLIAIAPFYLSFFVALDLRIVRVFRLLRVFKLTRYSPAMSMLLNVFREEADSFFAGFFILFILLILTASGAYLVEHQAQPDVFGSIPEAMWWAVVTLTTVGYGDVTPITHAGKIFGGLVTVIGVGMAALPAGILASGLNDHLHRRRKDLRNRFRLALLDGIVDAEEEEELEALRIELGISHDLAQSIRTEVLLKRARITCTCPNCGEQFSVNNKGKP